MSNTLYLKQSFIEMLLANGKSAQDLLVAIVRTSIDKDEKFEPCPERIAKQSELVKFCINNGASLKGAFKNVYEIPATFIENNLPLVIASQYDPTQVLQRITGIAYGLKNPLRLVAKLINDHKADAHKLSYTFVSDLDSGSIEFLLNEGMGVEILLQTAFENNSKKKQNELFKLAFKHGASASSFKSLHTSVKNCHEDIFEILIKKYKVPAQDLLNVLIHARVDQYNLATKESEPNPELIDKQTALMNFLIGNGANLKDISHSPSDFVKNHPSLVKEAKYFFLADLVPKDIEMDPVVLNLMKGVFVKKSYLEEYTNKIFLEFCYEFHKVMHTSPTIARVLNYVSQMPNLEIYIDDEGVLRNNAGTYYSNNGKIYIQHSVTDRVATIVHECFHKAFDTLYKNISRPYSPNDMKAREEISKLIESDLLVQELVPEYKSWFAMKKHPNYKKEQYDVELFTFLVDKLTNKILENTTIELGIGTREFTKGAWEILQKIVATIPVKNGTIHKPEAAPESLMLSEKESNEIQKVFISNKATEILTINPNLNFSSINFLLSKGMKGDVLLRSAFESKDREKQKELFDLAFKHGASTSSVKDLHTSVENCHEDIFQILMGKYKVPVQDLLNVIVCAETNQYNQVTLRQELTKQTELAKFCFDKGAKLKDAFKNIYAIPASFIENNLLLIVPSQYTATEVLQHITLNLYGLNDPSNLIKKLIDEHQADASKLSYISSDLDSQSIDFLLNKNMKGDALLYAAFNVKDNKEKQQELFDLAFKHGVNTTAFKDLNIPVEYCNEDILQILIKKYKVSVQDLLNVVFCAHSKKYNQATKQFELSEELLAKQKGLTHFLIKNGAHVEGMSGISTDFLEYLRQLHPITTNKVKAQDLDTREPSAAGEGLSTVAQPVKPTEVVATMGHDWVILDSL
jgi:hypothetical protein